MERVISNLKFDISDDLIERFSAELESVGGHVFHISSPGDVRAHLEQLIPRDVTLTVAVSDGAALGSAALREGLEQRGVRVLPSPREFAPRDEDCIERYKAALLEASLGVTTGDYGIADTGTVVLVSGGEQHRLISLVPPVHVCLLDSRRIFRDLASLMAHARSELYSGEAPPLAMTFITGPSRTADIELSLTLGVHGPRELHVLLYAG